MAFRGASRHFPAHAVFDQVGDALNSMTSQLRSAIEADAGLGPRGGAAQNPFGRAGGWERRISAELGTVLLDTLGLAATIEWHLRQFQKCTGVLHELTVRNAASVDLPEGHAAAIFSIYGEAISNVARHSGAKHVAVSLGIAPRDVVMVVRDNGAGMRVTAPARAAGGLAACRTLARRFKGLCEVAGVRDSGTTLTVMLPIL